MIRGWFEEKGFSSRGMYIRSTSDTPPKWKDIRSSYTPPNWDDIRSILDITKLGNIARVNSNGGRGLC